MRAGEGPYLSARLTHDPLCIDAATSQLRGAENGAIASFVGVVRAERDRKGNQLAALEYSAYDSMAQAEMGRILEQAARNFQISAATLEHRLGRLEIGEASVIAIVAAPHRAAAFDACRAIIEQLKDAVPIWKREIWEGGKMSWVE